MKKEHNKLHIVNILIEFNKDDKCVILASAEKLTNYHKFVFTKGTKNEKYIYFILYGKIDEAFEDMAYAILTTEKGNFRMYKGAINDFYEITSNIDKLSFNKI